MLRIESPFSYTKKIIYDLEFSGDLRDDKGINCCIWQIAAKDYDTGATFSVLINPYLLRKRVPKPVDNRYQMPTKKQFESKNAFNIKQALYSFELFLKTCMAEKLGTICLISHNGYRSDKIVLENALIRYNLNVFQNMNICFFDSLYYFRTIYPGLSSYSLANLYKEKFNKEIKDAHDAIGDVVTLEQLLKCDDKSIFGVIYPLYHTPFTNVPGIGMFTETHLSSYGFISVDHFLQHFKYNNNYIMAFLSQTPLCDRAKLLAERLHEFTTSELNQRMPRLLQQRKGLEQVRSEESGILVCN